MNLLFSEVPSLSRWYKATQVKLIYSFFAVATQTILSWDQARQCVYRRSPMPLLILLIGDNTWGWGIAPVPDVASLRKGFRLGAIHRTKSKLFRKDLIKSKRF
jgi:hypothetical protein